MLFGSDGFLLLGVLLAGFLLVLPLILLIAAWVRLSDHASQLDVLRGALRDVEARNRVLGSRLDGLQASVQTWRTAETAPPVRESVAATPPVGKPTVSPPPSEVIPPKPVAETQAAKIAPAAVEVSLIPEWREPQDNARDVPVKASAAVAKEAPVARPEAAPAAIPPAPIVHQPAEPVGPNLLERGYVAVRAWLLGGNTLVRVGMVLVFLGLAFLLRYASDRIVFPLEVRYLGVALSSLAALALGWRLRLKRPAYALLMQGGAVAVMYLTVFAALKLHNQPLLSTPAGFALLVAVVVLSGVLAVTQNALPLAMAGALGGFAAPVLVSTGGGSHVALFSYFALLNAGILGVAWFKAWRPLNLVGFFGTFSIGLAWGMRSYDRALHYTSTQLFLILFFLMFVAIGLLFARRILLDDPDAPVSRDVAEWNAWFARHGHTVQRYVDGTLLFGTPLVGFGLQYEIVRHIEYGTALSALALGFFYLVLARVVHGSNPLRHRLLTEVFLALGMVFASVAVPLGLDAQWTSAVWAVEGAGIYWVGYRQRRPLARAFALALQTGASIAFLSRLAPGGEDSLISGSALGALMLGLAFLGDMLVLRRHGEERHGQWDEHLEPVFGTIGLWSLFAVAPLLMLAKGVAVAWALAGCAVLFGALRQRFTAWTTHAALVQGGAFLLLMSTVRWGEETLLTGSLSTALLVGLALLSNVWLLRLFSPPDEEGQDESLFLPVLFSTLGLWSLYLIAPLRLTAEYTAAAWALAGMVTVFAALRLRARGWLPNALLVQLLAGLLFLSRMDTAGSAGGALALSGSGWRGLVIASLIGLTSLSSLGIALRSAQRRNEQEMVTRLAWGLLFGLGFISLAVLFALPWQSAAAVWAGCGFLLMWAAMYLKLRPPFWFALALEVIAGLAFLGTGGLALFDPASSPLEAVARPFAHVGFWTPIVLALAAFAVAWRLHVYARSPAAEDKDGLQISAPLLSLTSLLWAAGWWGLGWLTELRRIGETSLWISHYFLAAMAVSVLAMLPVAARWRWAHLAVVCGFLLPTAAIVALLDYSADTNLLAVGGWAAFGLGFAASLGLLRAGVLGQRLHLVNAWVWLGVAALEMRHVFMALGEPGSAWRWLGWTLPLAAWLLWSARKTLPRLWPVAVYPSLYRFNVTALLVPVLLVWAAIANIESSGNAAPLPFIPLMNPLDLALALVLFTAWQWLRQWQAQEAAAWRRALETMRGVLLAEAFVFYTCIVLRGAHHIAAVPWETEAMLHSMAVQASLSIAWALLALGLMVMGHRHARRPVWIAGAVLVAVVVAKLFFIELSNRGGLERIVSFIVVGILLLVVGYFAPLPPSKGEKQ